MKKPRKILSLVTTLAATTTAAMASPDTPRVPARWADAPNAAVVLLGNTPYLVTPGVAPVPVPAAELGRYLGETQPLVGPDGRPGCGNILSKGPTGCEDAQTKAVAARLAAARADATVAAREAAIAHRAAARIEQLERVRTAAKAK
jgi:hypothetical protein